MKVLIVCSKNSGHIAPFILEQAQALERAGVELEFFAIEGKGLGGYLKNRKKLIQKIQQFNPEIIHAHYGLSGLLANTQRKVPVVTTYHGSDINIPSIFFLLRLNMILSKHNIFVSEKIIPMSPKSPRSLSSVIWRILSPTGERQRKYSFWDLIRVKRSLIPCGIDIELFKQFDKIQSREALNMVAEKKYVLFAGAYNIPVKNAALARAAISVLPDVELIELNGYSREQVALLLNAVDVVLMTSFTEGSPQIIKEAMACNCPVVSVPVGDVPEMIDNIEGCFISSYDPNDVAAKLKLAMSSGKLTDGRKRIVELSLDNESVAGRILEVYKGVRSKK